METTAKQWLDTLGSLKINSAVRGVAGGVVGGNKT